MNPFQDFINSIKGAPQTVGNDLNASAIGSLNPFNFQPQQFLPRAGQDLVKAVGTPQHPNMFLAGEMGPAGAEEGAMGGLVDKTGAPLKAPTEVYSRGQPVKLNPEAQASVNATSNGTLPNIGEDENMNTAPQTLPNIGSTEDPLAQIKTQENVEQGLPATPPKVIQPKSNPNVIEKAGQRIKGDVRQIRMPAGIGGAQDEAAINETLDRLGFTGNAENQYEKLQPTMNKLNNQIQTELQTNPKTVSLDEVKQAFTKNIQDSVRRGEIDTPTANKAISSYLNSLYNTARDANPEDPIPTEITTQDLYPMKVTANSDASNAFRKMSSGLPLTDADKVALAGRNALDGIITKYHPVIKQATVDMSRLYDAAPSLSKARDVDHGFKLFGSDIPSLVAGIGKSVVGGTVQGVGKIAGSPVGKGLGVAGLVGTGIGIDRLSQSHFNPNGINNPADDTNNPQNGSQNNQTGKNIEGQGNQSGNIVSQPYSKIKADPKTGHFELPQTPPPGTNQRHYETLQDHNNAIASINSSYTSGTPAYNAAMTAENARWNGDQEQAKVLVSNPNVSDFMNNAPQYNADGKNLQDALAAPGAIGFWNGVKNVGSVRAYNDPQYQSLKQQIMAFNDEFSATYKAVTGKDPGSDLQLDTANSGAQAGAKYKAMMQWMSGTYGKYLDPWLAITSGTGAQTSTGTPESGAVGLPAPTSQGLAPILSHPQAFQPTGQEFENGNP